MPLDLKEIRDFIGRKEYMDFNEDMASTSLSSRLRMYCTPTSLAYTS